MIVRWRVGSKWLNSFSRLGCSAEISREIKFLILLFSRASLTVILGQATEGEDDDCVVCRAAAGVGAGAGARAGGGGGGAGAGAGAPLPLAAPASNAEKSRLPKLRLLLLILDLAKIEFSLWNVDDVYGGYDSYHRTRPFLPILGCKMGRQNEVKQKWRLLRSVCIFWQELIVSDFVGPTLLCEECKNFPSHPPADSTDPPPSNKLKQKNAVLILNPLIPSSPHSSKATPTITQPKVEN